MILLRHQNIGRLQVPVHDQVGMRILNRSQYLLEQLDSRPNVESEPIAIQQEWRALDVFHREVRLTLRTDPCVVQARDLRVCQG